MLSENIKQDDIYFYFSGRWLPIACLKKVQKAQELSALLSFGNKQPSIANTLSPEWMVA